MGASAIGTKMEESINEGNLARPGPETLGELEARGLAQERASLSASRLRKLFDHQRWLGSNGSYGQQLNIEQSFTAHRRDFVNNDLDGVDFSRADFKNVSFVLCTLREAHFSGAKLQSVDFLECDLTGTDFNGAVLNGVTFQESNQREARFGNGIIWKPYTDGSVEIFHP